METVIDEVGMAGFLGLQATPGYGRWSADAPEGAAVAATIGSPVAGGDRQGRRFVAGRLD
jgi:hypothetical protein